MADATPNPPASGVPLPIEDNIIVGGGNTLENKEPTPSNTANRSSSVLSDAPLTDEGEGQAEAGAGRGDGGDSTHGVNGSATNGINGQVDDFATPTRGGKGIVRGRGGGRPRGRGRGGGFAGNGTLSNGGTPNGDTETPTPGKGRGRGRGGGRPRGRGKGASRSGKRKRGDDDDEDASDSISISSDEVTPIATMTKSGRSVQKPTTFVPPTAPSPTTNPTHKRKRVFTRRNPESAVCKVCLRGTSPTSNMIVFCDGCNSPYHRFCHQPAIEQSVVDVVDKEWFCRRCVVEREEPVPEGEVSGFVAVEGVSVEQRQQYFASLPSGILVTLLTRATTIQPSLPVFAPDFANRIQAASAATDSTITISSAPAINGHPPPFNITNSIPPPPSAFTHSSKPQRAPTPPAESYYGPDVHPAQYPRPGQGLMKSLPRDKDDESRLVEEDRYGVFTHFWKPDARIEEASQRAGDGHGGATAAAGTIPNQSGGNTGNGVSAGASSAVAAPVSGGMQNDVAR